MQSTNLTLNVNTGTLRWINSYCRFRNLSVSEITERLWRELREIIGDDYLPAPRPYIRELTATTLITVKSIDEEALQWIRNYSEFHRLSVSEVTERLFERLRKHTGEVDIPANDYTNPILKDRLRNRS